MNRRDALKAMIAVPLTVAAGVGTARMAYASPTVRLIGSGELRLTGEAGEAMLSTMMERPVHISGFSSITISGVPWDREKVGEGFKEF